MTPSLVGPYEKVKRAKKHINDLIVLLTEFAKTDFYTVTIEERQWKHGWLRNEIVVTLDPRAELRTEVALIIGDVLHNLKSSLDLLFYQVVLACGGTPSDHTRFPVRNTREELETTLNGAVKEKTITETIEDFIVNTIQPYEAGNNTLWALHRLNIRDKHELLIPVFQMVGIRHICLVNENNIIFEYPPVLTTDSFKRYLPVEDFGRYPKVQDKGKAATGVGFDFDVPNAGESVISTLNGIAEEVTRTIQAFKKLLF